MRRRHRLHSRAPLVDVHAPEILGGTNDHEIVVAYTSTGPEMYVKLNGTWRQVSKAYRKVSGSWQEVALDQAFQSGVNYKME